jgi:hypothetical protein
MTKHTRSVVVKDDKILIGTGTLIVDVIPGSKNTGLFIPMGPLGNDIPLVNPVWNEKAGQTVSFHFRIEESNGDFPAGSYHFTGTQTPDGNPHGTVLWPGRTPGSEEVDTWQSSATQDEPKAKGQGKY